MCADFYLCTLVCTHINQNDDLFFFIPIDTSGILSHLTSFTFQHITIYLFMGVALLKVIIKVVVEYINSNMCKNHKLILHFYYFYSYSGPLCTFPAPHIHY